MATMNISLPDALKARVEEQVRTGRYGNSSDYVRDLVRREQERADARREFERIVCLATNTGAGDPRPACAPELAQDTPASPFALPAKTPISAMLPGA